MSKITHGKSRYPGGKHTSEYTAWMNMRQRCSNPKFIGYERYGGRGISVCQEWADSFASFIEDMGPKPTPQHTLDRIDNSRGYDPLNCRWATRKEQSANRRNSVFIDGRPLVDVCSELGLKEVTVRGRIRKGLPKERWLEGRAAK